MLAKHVLYQLSYTPSMPGALPLNTPRPFRLSNFLAKVPARPVACWRLETTKKAGLVAGFW